MTSGKSWEGEFGLEQLAGALWGVDTLFPAWHKAHVHRDRLCRFMAFDRHMNLVLGDAEEYRKLPPKKGIPDDEVWGVGGRCRVRLPPSAGVHLQAAP